MRASSHLPLVRLGVLVILAAVATPLSGLAQQPLTTIEVEARIIRQNARADTLEAQALTLYGIPREFAAAARLHRRAAVLRGEDPRAVESFRSAAWMFSAARDNSSARMMMEKAAERASAAGDVEKSANAYIDAALIAVSDGREDKVPALLQKMRIVLGSPLLSADRRATILRRVDDTPTLARVDGTR